MKRCVAGIVIKRGMDAEGVIHFKVFIGKKIVKEGHYLSDQWHIPGGHIMDGETEEEAVMREMKEECNLDVKVLEKIVDKIFEDFSLAWYICSTQGGAKAGDDLQEVKWVDKKDVCNACSPIAVSRWPDELKEFLLK